MSSGPSLGVAYLTVLPTMKGSAKTIERELGNVPAAAVGGKLGRQLSGGLKSAATTTMAVVGAAAGTAFVKGFGRLKAIDTAKAKLKGLGNDAKTIELVMKNAGASVKGTAFGLDAAATAAAGAMAAGIKPGKELERNLKLVADAATIAGTDMGSMGAIFNKAAASNKVQMDVINQLHDAGVPALSFLAKTMGVTAEEASKMASKGEINFKIFQDAMEQGLGGAAQSSGDTFTGAMANVFAALGRIGAGIMGGVFPKLAPLFQRIQASLGPIEERASALGAVLGEKLTPVFEKVFDLLEGGTGKLDSLKAVLGPAAGAFASLGASGLAPLLGMVPGLGGLAGVLSKLGGPLGIIVGAFLGMVASSPELQAALGSLLGALGGIAQQLAPALQDIATLLTGALAVGLGWFADALTAVVGWLAAAVDAVAPYSDVLVSLGVGIGGVVIAFKAWTVAGNTLRAAMAVWKAAQMGWTAASYGAVGASYAATAATKGQVVATKLAAGAQRVLNLVMRANPLGLIVTAVTAVVGALTWFFTKTELGKKLWGEFTRFLGEAWTNIKGFFISAYEGVILPVFEGIKTAIGAVGSFFQTVWTDYLKPVFDGVGAVATWVFQNILQPVFQAGQTAFAIMAGIFQGVYESILKPIFDGFGAVLRWLYDVVIVPVVEGIKLYVQAWAAIFQWLWGTILKPVFTAVGAIFQWLYRNVVVPIVGFIRTTITALGAVFTWLYRNAVKPAIDAAGAVVQWLYRNVVLPTGLSIQIALKALGQVFTWLYRNAVKPAIDGAGAVFTWLKSNVIDPVWNGIKNTIAGVWNNGIKPVIDTLVKIVKSDPKHAFEAARDAIGKAWRGIQELAAKPVRFVVDTVINGLIGTINKTPGVNLSKVSLPKGFAGGGVLPGYMSAKRDDVLMPMRSGEGVLVPEVVRGLGPGFVHALNAVGNTGGVGAVRRRFAGIGAGLARGGLVTPLPDGTWNTSQPWHGGHNGLDMAAPQGTPVMAAANGVVQLAGVVPMGGNEIYIQHDNGLGTRYSHLSAFTSRVGQKVRQRQTIGRVGSTGMSTGPHLHYMVHNPGRGPGSYYPNVNPAAYLKGGGKVLGEAWNPLTGLIDVVASQIKNAFPAGGMWVDAAAGIAKDAAKAAIKHFTPKIGSDGRTTLYDNGGLLPTGISLVENRTGTPEPILSPQKWRDLTDGRAGNGAGDTYEFHISSTEPRSAARETVRRLRRRRFEKQHARA